MKLNLHPPPSPRYNIHTMDNNVFLSLCGPTEHLREFYSSLIKNVFMLCTKMDLDQFDERRKRVQTFIDHAKVSPEQLADNILQFLTKNPAFLFTDQLNDFPKLTIADLMAFSSQLLCQLSVNMYVAGTVSEEMAALSFAPGTYHYKMDGQSTDSLNGTYYFVRYSICLRGDALAEACNRVLVVRSDSNRFHCY
ncbi:hypothetical protein FGIG_08540 [Fasciola gigantica]|uniref:Uncharacterized protein n=1 Tax=Fasciola gigantica TaxID=46835 RepID=A0A504Z8K3_FASGI|nr:hypothetical protein FGIG_08540 [Fasciola gigantica]